MATIQKRGNSYRIKVSCGYDSKGKQVVQSMTWTPDDKMTKKQIEKELQRQSVLFEEACLKGNIVATIKFEEFAHQWFEEYATRNLRATTYHRTVQLEARTYKAIGHIRLDKITTRHIQQFINSLSEDGVNKTTGKGLAQKTIKHYLSFISTIFDYAIRMQMLTDNPCKRVFLPPSDTEEREIYTIEEVQKMLVLLENEPLKYRTFFTLAVYGGFRRGEMMGLEWKDLDFETNVITIKRSSLYTPTKGTFTDTTKTKSSQRSLKLPASVFEVLKLYKAEQDSEKEKLGNRWIETDRLFTTWDGKPMNSTTISTWLSRFCKRHDMRYCNIHSMRHFNATTLINAGVDIKTVQSCLGHSVPTTTLNLYCHTIQAAQAKAMDAVANVIEGKVS